MGALADNIQGIGPASEAKLAAAGIHSLDDLRRTWLVEAGNLSGISMATLRSWQQMALLQLIPGIDTQFAEGLVKSSIPDAYALAHIDVDTIISALADRAREGMISRAATEVQVLSWRHHAAELMAGRSEGQNRLAVEVSVVWEAMNCRAARNYYEKNDHACRWFHQFGPFHAYDVTAEDSLQVPEGYLHAFYAGRRYQVPELLSGCRKAPVMSIGLNPNLRAVKDKKRIYPYFDDIRQYAEHFRYRTNYKYRIETAFFNDHAMPNTDDAVFAEDELVPLKKSYVSMYNEYKDILDGFQVAAGIADADLKLGEDVSYYNFVACHSPRWNMPSAEEEGIIQECFRHRQYFLRQLRQSSPQVVIIFGKPIMRQFAAFFRDHFDPVHLPDPNASYTAIMADNNYVMHLENQRIRVIFSSHPTGNRAYYQQINARDKIVAALKDEYEQGRLTYNAAMKHFDRSQGSCEYCSNELFYIGDCPYGTLKSLGATKAA